MFAIVDGKKSKLIAKISSQQVLMCLVMGLFISMRVSNSAQNTEFQEIIAFQNSKIKFKDVYKS